MSTTPHVTNISTDNRHGPYTIGSVMSADGTTISYRQLGHGPAIVLLHGGASSGYNHIQEVLSSGSRPPSRWRRSTKRSFSNRHSW